VKSRLPVHFFTKIKIMRIRFFLLLTAAITIFACNNAPASTESQPAEPRPEVAPVETAAAEAPVPDSAPAAEAAPEKPSSPAPAKKEAAPAPVKPVSTKKESPVSEIAPKPDSPEKPEPETASPPAGKVVFQDQEISDNVIIEDKKPASPQPPSHDAWDKLLQQYVSAAGKVNYAGFKKDKAKLETYLDILQKNAPQNDWSRAEKMAFWINAYNAFTVKLIVDNYPVSSIMKLDGGKPWDRKWINIGGKSYSLNNIENDILRPQFKDARIHFAVNCAAKSCPPLLNRAWTAANLESNFEKQARAFINNPNFNKISAKEVEVSKIFEWYASDFGNLIEYLNKYSATKINANAKVKYREYDWALNE
jgi:hypothetical protein